MAAKLRTGDRVVVITGPERGNRGEITKVIRKEQRAVVSNLNFSVRHRRESPGKPAGIERFEAPIHLSNLALVDPRDDLPTRVGFRFEEKNGVQRRVRFAKRSGESIDG
jgi:large subunit ribosomal protein L24